MNVTMESPDKMPWYKHRWPWLLMLGPGIVIIAGIVTVWLAVVSNDGLVSDDYYKQGLAVNQRLQRDHKAGELGMKADLMRSGEQLRLMMTADPSLQMPSELIVRFMHPTQAGRDMAATMKAEGQGFYAGRLAADIGGRWRVSIEDPAGQWRLQGDWEANADEPLRLSGRAGN